VQISNFIISLFFLELIDLQQYDECNPSKFLLGNDHLDALVESKSMAAVEGPGYILSLPQEVTKLWNPLEIAMTL
jgi:hypothetical protein